MEWNLSPEEVRVLGALIEKEATTPDQYPLSINTLTQACNQKSNRTPVMTLSEPDVRLTVNGLLRRGLVRHASGYSGRVSRFEHRLGSTSVLAVRLDPPELAVLALLFLRGAQTPGELRARSQRMTDLADIPAVEDALHHLETHPDGPLVWALPREPGKREQRYDHRLGQTAGADEHAGDAAGPSEAVLPADQADSAGALESRISALEQEVASLRRAVAELQRGS
ncbi:MAG TPA: YceH family protein [Gammaproteobacteria bacterium]|nr:YceH family protein [Gammaproteobacteria bacterium]